MSELLSASAVSLRLRLQTAPDTSVQSGRLSAREKRVVVMRLALADGQWHTLTATAAASGGVGKERVRQLQNRALWELHRLETSTGARER